MLSIVLADLCRHDGERQHLGGATSPRPCPFLSGPSGRRVPDGDVGATVGRQQGGTFEEALACGDEQRRLAVGVDVVDTETEATERPD